MAVYIHNIATAVPETSYSQDFLRDKMKEYVSDKRSVQRYIHRIYTHSGIEKRHTVVGDFNGKADDPFFFHPNGQCLAPGTGSRNELYTKHAQRLFVEVGKKLLQERPHFKKQDITHVITVSCTGFYAPGPDYTLIRDLGLAPSTQRYHLGFMGCYAAFPALKMARSFCESNEHSVVMVICLELCTLHFQFREEMDNLISSSVFADGAAGALVSQRTPQQNTNAFRLENFSTTLTDDGENDMAWTIGDSGFNMVLSTYVPQIIESNLQKAITPLFEKMKLQNDDIDYWALHPGGRAILDKVEKNFSISSTKLTASRETLKNFGNMSSATILFVLKNILDQAMNNDHETQTVLGMAFGPGLTIESGLFTKQQF